MAKIQGVKRTVSQPGSLGQARASLSTYAPIAQGAQELGNKLDTVGQRIENDKQTVAISKMDTEFRQWSRELYMDDQLNRQGEGALGDDENPNVYDNYFEKSEKRMGEMVSSLPPRYQEAGRKVISTAAEGYRNKYAGYLVQQQNANRDNVIKQSTETSITELAHDMEDPAAGIEDIFEAKNKIKAVAMANAGGRNMDANIEAGVASAAESAVLAKSNKNALAAEEMLKDDRMKELLSPAEIDALEIKVEKDRVDQGAQALVAKISNLPPEEQSSELAKFAKANPDDAQIAKTAKAEVDFINNAEKEAKTISEFNEYSRIWDDIVNKDGVYTPIEITSNEDMSISQRKSLLTAVTGEGKAWENPHEKQKAKLEAQRNIRMNRPGWRTTDEIIEQSTAGSFDPRDLGSVHSTFEEWKVGKGLAYDVENRARSMYSGISNNNAIQVGVYVTDRIRAEMGKKGDVIDQKLMDTYIKEAHKGILYDNWTGEPAYEDVAEERFGAQATKPQRKFVFKDDRIPFSEVDVLQYQQQGFPESYYKSLKIDTKPYPDAYYLKSDNLIVLEESGGVLTILQGGNKYEVPAGSKEGQAILKGRK